MRVLNGSVRDEGVRGEGVRDEGERGDLLVHTFMDPGVEFM